MENLSSLIDFFEIVQGNLSEIYSVVSTLIVVGIALWILNFIITFTYRVFLFGRSVGYIYRNYFHRYIRFIFRNRSIIKA